MKNIERKLVGILAAAFTTAIVFSGCDFNGNPQRTNSTSDIADGTETAAEAQNDRLFTETEKGYYYGTGYKFKLPENWIYVSPDEKNDLVMIYNSMDITDNYGVINMKISSFRLGENGFTSDDEGLQYYYIDDYVYTTMNSIWGLSIEQIQGLETAELNGLPCFDTVYTSLYDIISYDLNDIPKDENGYYIMDDISEVSAKTFTDVKCTLKKYFIRNGDAVIKIEFIIPDEDIESLEKTVEKALSYFTLTEPLPKSELITTQTETTANVWDNIDESSKMSDDIYSFQFLINGKFYQLPIKVSEFIADGWIPDEELNEQLDPYRNIHSLCFDRGDAHVYAQIVNLENNTKPFSDCFITQISFRQSEYENQNITCRLPGGFMIGVSTPEDVRSICGEPSYEYKNDEYASENLRYELEPYKNIQYYFTNGILNEFEMENITYEEEESEAYLPDDDIPDSLSDDLYSFQFKCQGIIYKLPMTFKKFCECGWKYEGEETALEAYDRLPFEKFKNGDMSIQAEIMNLTDADQPIENCYITSFDFLNNASAELILPKNITLNKSTIDDVISAYGNPTYTHYSEEYATFEYNYNDTGNIDFSGNSKFTLSFSDGLLYNIKIQNHKKPRDYIYNHVASDIDVEVSTEIEKSYSAPSGLGNDIMGSIFSLDNKLYRLPVPVSAFLENGWEIQSEDIDMTILPKRFYDTYLFKDNQMLRVYIGNTSSYEVGLSACSVTGITLSGEFIPFKIQNNITYDMTRENLENALAGTGYQLSEDNLYAEYRWAKENISYEYSLVISVDAKTNKVVSIYLSV